VKLYCAGPMRGLKYYNFPAFDAAAEELRGYGHEVINPADLDRDRGFNPENLPEDYDWNELPVGMDLKEVILEDVGLLLTCDAVVVLDGWYESRGATAEFYTAMWAGIPVFTHEYLSEVGFGEVDFEIKVTQ
jgi:hypothetical protein